MLSIEGLRCVAGSPEALVQPGDMAEGDVFMGLFVFSWKKHKGVSSALTAVGCF